MSRWRKPATILDVAQNADGETVTFGDGRVLADADIALPESDIERIRQGYLCLNCLEPQEEPFPLYCTALRTPDGTAVGCFYPMRDQQLRDFAARYGGERQIGGNVKLADEAARLSEIMEFEERTGIVLPDHVKFPQGEI